MPHILIRQIFFVRCWNRVFTAKSLVYQCAVVNRWHRRRPIRNMSKNSENVSFVCDASPSPSSAFNTMFSNFVSRKLYFALHRQNSSCFVRRKQSVRLRTNTIVMIDLFVGPRTVQCHWLRINVFPIFLLTRNRNKNLEEHIASLEADLKSTSADLYGSREQVTYYKAENKNLHDEMAVINQVRFFPFPTRCGNSILLKLSVDFSCSVNCWPDSMDATTSTSINWLTCSKRIAIYWMTWRIVSAARRAQHNCQKFCSIWCRRPTKVKLHRWLTSILTNKMHHRHRLQRQPTLTRKSHLPRR